MNNKIEPLPNPFLSLCMIVKNERNNLPRCLASVKPYVDEMIVVDTGSQDGTPELALEHGAKVTYFEWCDDFAAARNYAISKASGEWILMLDADEELVVNSESFLDEITSHREFIAYAVTYAEINNLSYVTTPSYRLSLFRNVSGIRYEGRFHETIAYHNEYITLNDVKQIQELRIVHYGFNKEELLQKDISRNIPILERIRQEESLSLRLLYTLAERYADTSQLEKSQECYAEAFDRLLPHLMNGNLPQPCTSVASLLYTLGIQFTQHNDYETARLICQRGLEWCPNFPPLNYLAGITLRALGFPLGASAYFENCIQMGQEETYNKLEHFNVCFMTTYPAYDLGCLYIDLGRLHDALAAFELALSFNANLTLAQEKIEQIKHILSTL